MITRLWKTIIKKRKKIEITEVTNKYNKMRVKREEVVTRRTWNKKRVSLCTYCNRLRMMRYMGAGFPRGRIGERGSILLISLLPIGGPTSPPLDEVKPPMITAFIRVRDRGGGVCY